MILCLFLVTGIPARAPSSAARDPDPGSRTTDRDPGSPQAQIESLKAEQLALVQTLLQEFPDHERAVVLMGDVLNFQGREMEAAEFWKRGLAMNPRRADVHRSLGRQALARGDYETAVVHGRQALEIEPKMADVYDIAGLGLMGLGRHQEAVAELEKGLKAGTLAGFDHFVLGQGYLQLGKLKEAKSSYETALRLRPDLTNAYYGLFAVCTRLNERDQAARHLARFKELKAEDMKVLKDRNDAHSDLREVRVRVATSFLLAGSVYQKAGNLEKAEPVFRRAAELDPQNAEVLNELGAFYEMSGRLAEALAAYQRAAALEPPPPVSCLNAGLLATRLKRYEEAEAAFRTVIRVNPDRSEGYRELAQLYLRANTRLPEARQLAEKAIALEPVAANYFVLSRAYDQGGDPARALAALKRAVDLEPGNEKYQQVYNMLRAREAKR